MKKVSITFEKKNWEIIVRALLLYDELPHYYYRKNNIIRKIEKALEMIENE